LFPLLTAGLIIPATTQPPTPTAEREQVERLANVCKVWGTCRYLHPYLAYKDIDWDAALIKALPNILAAKQEEEYAAAVQTMLEALGDPATRVVPKSTPGGLATGKPGDTKLLSWVE
jgi:hypothetical protein